ncbi:MAG: acyltransferase [Promethearchaeota archaeon]
MNILTQFFRRLCRTLAKSAFPNFVRIFLFKLSGIHVGKDVVINEGFTLACDIGNEENLIIEDRVAIAPNVTIIITSQPNNSRLRLLSDRYIFIERFSKVIIQHDVWIGACVVILPGVTIGKYSVIGAGSIVTKDVPPFTVVAGVPAKPIREFTEDDIKLLTANKNINIKFNK